MEFDRGTPERHLSHGPCYLTPEQLAVRAIADEMIRKADERAYARFNNILDEMRSQDKIEAEGQENGEA